MGLFNRNFRLKSPISILEKPIFTAKNALKCPFFYLFSSKRKILFYVLFQRKQLIICSLRSFKTFIQRLFISHLYIASKYEKYAYFCRFFKLKIYFLRLLVFSLLKYPFCFVNQNKIIYLLQSIFKDLNNARSYLCLCL